MLDLFCDGSIGGSHWAPKGQKHTLPHCWSGWVAKTPSGEVVHHHALDLGEHPLHSANVAEYAAVRSALHWMTREHPLQAARIFSDSQVIIRQLAGVYECHNERLLVLRDACRALAARLPQVTYHWIRREENRYADFMSKALRDGGSIPPVPVPPEVVEQWR